MPHLTADTPGAAARHRRRGVRRVAPQQSALCSALITPALALALLAALALPMSLSTAGWSGASPRTAIHTTAIYTTATAATAAARPDTGEVPGTLVPPQPEPPGSAEPTPAPTAPEGPRPVQGGQPSGRTGQPWFDRPSSNPTPTERAPSDRAPRAPDAAGPGPIGPGTSGAGTAGSGAQGAGASTSAPAPWWDVKAQAASAINTWLSGVVSGAMAPIAQVGGSLLDPRRLTGVTALQQLWSNSRAVANGLFGLLILAGAMVIAGYETVQTRWALKEIAPRIVLGFLAANLSWTVITASITGAAALAVAVAGNGLAPGQILTQVLTATLAGGPIFTVLLQLVLLGVAVALVVGLVVVGVLLMLLTVTAPLALCLHALPQTEQIAYLWWRALTATLAIPVLQGLILALLARVVLQPGGYGLLGIPPLLTGAGTLLNLLVTLALLWVMVTLPARMWRIATGRSSRGGGLVRGLVKTALGVAVLSGIGGPIGATLGRAAAGGRGIRTSRALWSMLATTPPNTSAGRRRPRPATAPAANPWARVHQTGSGQLILPLPGVRRVPRPRPTPTRRAPTPSPAASTGARRAPGGWQLSLFSRAELLNTSRLGRDGQYELPLHLTPTTHQPTRTRTA